jgi:flagellar hook-associated protein 1
MAISSFSGINLALRAMTAQQAALDVTGHNIANAQTVGYTRQRAEMATPSAVTTLQGTGAVALGQGVDVTSLARLRDTFLDLQVRAAQLAAGQDGATATALGQVEDVLAEGTDSSLGALLDRFWSSWQDLSSQPESSAAKTAVAGHATTLAGALQTLDARLQALGGAAAAQATQLQAAGGPVDQAAQELARLNAAIGQAVTAGSQPNDLLDRRDLLLDRLSELGQVSVTDLGSGSIEVRFGDALAPLVSGPTVTWPQTLTAPGGEIGALLTFSGTTVPAYRAALDGVAAGLTSTVNGLHPTPVFSATTAATFTAVVTPGSVRASSTAAAGGNDVARAIAALRGGAADTAYADLVQRIGMDAATANAGEATSKAVLGQLEARRQSVSGVSLDEEMANMIRFQRGYQASARAMSTVDEMLDTLINRTGRVGL